MNKKIGLMLISILLTSLLLSGCLEETKPLEENLNQSGNLYPIGIISAPEKAYFGELIEFDASDSYDSDGKIVSYSWDFGDDQTAEGILVNHIFIFENNFTIDYPLIYSINLFITDNDGAISVTSHQIMIYPKEYLFYLSSTKLVIEKPSFNLDKIKGSGLFKLSPPQILKYDLDKSITVKKCTWNATIYLKKPLFIKANKISIIFYDNEGNQITKKDKQLGLSILWKEKTLQIGGAFDQEEEFKSVEIVVNGFSIGKKISIMYGDDKASHICFNFRT